MRGVIILTVDLGDRMLIRIWKNGKKLKDRIRHVGDAENEHLLLEVKYL